jgi:hypothetical protein
VEPAIGIHKHDVAAKDFHPHPLRMSVKNVRLMPPAAMPVKRLQPAFLTANLVKG